MKLKILLSIDLRKNPAVNILNVGINSVSKIGLLVIYFDENCEAVA